MCFKIGDQVAVLDDVLKGVVVSINNQVVDLRGIDGMIYQFNKSELVVIEQDQYKISKYLDINNTLLEDKIKSQKTKKNIFKKDKKEVILEIDLHINKLVKSSKGMNNFEILSFQLDTAKRKIEFSIDKRISKIIFIHGVGTGVLKTELHSLFFRYPVKFYDASYKKYGLGATEVHIYQNIKS
tara:strand:- start:11946 stop:12494 length:549 start_codon:yes stop_codon:yes gene_type:complete